MRGILFIAFMIFLSKAVINAQSSNVDCASAFDLGIVTDYCSEEEEFDSEDVGNSGYTTPSCWSDSQNDLWFTFVATKTSIEILVNSINGTMDNPEISLLKGEDCDNLLDIGACEVNMSNLNITSLFESSMVVGERYFIRIDARTNGNDGTFQLCIESYNPPINPGQDCATASILCDKESFVVQSIEGDGLEENEAAGSCLDVGSDGSENNSTWFKWTCSVSGTFTFVLKPLLITDDYDFAIFELPNGIDDCEKNIIRCGATNGGDLNPCGPNTGLDLVSTDLEEFASMNCNPGDDGFLRFIDMEAGKSYALLINNFSDSDAGFSLDFGGTAEFQGPTADFALDFGTCGTTVGIEDASLTGVSDIVEYEWQFGTDALPQSATGPGPFEIEFGTYGIKNITLKVVSALGCQVFVSKEIDLQPCAYIDSLEIRLDSINNIGCGGASTGYIAVSPSIDCGNYDYNIDGGPWQSEPIFDNLSSGDHIIGFRENDICYKDTTFTITEVADFTVDAGDDVTITSQNVGVDLNVMTTAVGDVTVSWSPNTGLMCTDGSDNCLNPNINVNSEQVFTVTVTDENGCSSTDQITVFTDFCGASDFVLDAGDDITIDFPRDTVSPLVGMPGSADLTISWTSPELVICPDGTTNCFNPELVVSETTTFTITVIDEFGCQRTDELTIVVPDVCATSNLAIQVDSLRGDYCNGAIGSFLAVSGQAGNPGYLYSINNSAFDQENTFSDLPVGLYNISIRDAFNCEQSIAVAIEEILGFTVDAGENITIDGLEPFEMLNASHDAFGDVNFSWAPQNGIFCPDGSTNCLDPSVNPLVTTTYTITATDEFGCTASDEVLVIVEERLGIYAPNIFSPNEDGFNDIFTLLTDPQIVQSIDRFSVFDRWGNLVFSRLNMSMNDPGAGWDGRMGNILAESGVYTWFAEVTVIDNLTGQPDLKKTVKGDITLVR
jgi:gliding motility-associated-like protein